MESKPVPFNSLHFLQQNKKGDQVYIGQTEGLVVTRIKECIGEAQGSLKDKTKSERNKIIRSQIHGK